MSNAASATARFIRSNCFNGGKEAAALVSGSCSIEYDSCNSMLADPNIRYMTPTLHAMIVNMCLRKGEGIN